MPYFFIWGLRDFLSNLGLRDLQHDYQIKKYFALKEHIALREHLVLKEQFALKEKFGLKENFSLRKNTEDIVYFQFF